MAVNTIFRSWNIFSSMSPVRWNTEGDICLGPPSSADKKNFYDHELYNPFILCDCTYINHSVCHVTRLKAYDLEIVGTIPEALRNLTYLENLQIAQNYLTGPLPAFIGNFTSMEYLSIGKNSLSGRIPKELGNLKKLKSLGMGMNNFSGSLPPELGNLTDLEQMYVDSIGVSGELPSSLAKLQKLKIMWPGDNNFGGRLPDFIGSLYNLESVRIQGNSFQGPIPSTFANLTKMTQLRLCDLSNESSSLDFIRNMTSLSILILRDSQISGLIPSNIGQYTNLTHLDLSFNNLTGQLPQSLFSLATLERLYLGNNKISGELPMDTSANLRDIDLSYNELSGSLPSWTTRSRLRLNLVANNFIDESNNDLPWGLKCLQKSVPCYRGSPVYYSFAINSGGGDSIEFNGMDYEADDEDLSATPYYVTDSTRWAVSVAGTYLEAVERKYVEYNSSNFMNTLEPKLFQSVRISPSSLRYYGLALENGNYTIAFHFAETSFPDSPTWQSTGKRIFNIYIQGNLIVKDFDIRREAGGKSLTAITRNYTAVVTDNFLDIHLFWAGKGTCCIPTQGYYGPSISAISVTPNFKPTVSNRLPSTSRNKALVSGLAIGAAVVLIISLLCVIYVWRRKRRQLSFEWEELHGLPIKPHAFSFAELKIATQDFNPANKLGQGGFGPVFKGKLSDGRAVAVKQLSVPSLQGKRQFATEVATISAVQHKNLVKLYGCCYEGENRLLVYEYLDNKSLDHALFGKSGLKLDWPARFDICLGTAGGLAYLHEESSIRIVHRDIKASNILLDADLNPKISDFGLAKLYDDKMTHISTRIAGTVGYLAPEYAMRGHLTEKVDVFGFGVVVLEILSGRPNTGSVCDGERTFLLDWAWQLHENKCDLEILDPSLSSFNKIEALRMIGVAFLCTQMNPMLRPPMSRVVAMLVGDAEVSDVTSKPVYLTDWNYDSSFMTGSTTTTDVSMLNQTSLAPAISPTSSALLSFDGR